MSVYGGFDDRFRPRPGSGRLALSSICQFVIAVWIANALVSTADMAVWRVARVQRAWIVYLPPWTTLKAEAARRIAPVAQREYAQLTPFIAGGLVLLGLLLLFFWPAQQTLGGRLFSVRLAQCITLFGAGFALRRNADLSPPVLIEIAVAASVVAAGEWQMNAVMAQMIDLRRAVLRLGQWFARVLPGTVAIAAAAYFAEERIVLYLAAIFAALTLLADLVHRSAARYEQIDKPELRATTLISFLIAAAIVGGCGWAFGFKPVRAPRVVVVTLHVARMETWDQLVRDLPGMFPVFDIHWTTPAEKSRVKRLAPPP